MTEPVASFTYLDTDGVPLDVPAFTGRVAEHAHRGALAFAVRDVVDFAHNVHPALPFAWPGGKPATLLGIEVVESVEVPPDTVLAIYDADVLLTDWN